jgi:uncharacterized protein Smg (DUF494 family)
MDAQEMNDLTDVDKAREREIKAFVSHMRLRGFAESDCDLADVMVRGFLKYAETDGWRLMSYLVGPDYEIQLNVKGEKE